jgi:hypothetical protein
VTRPWTAGTWRLLPARTLVNVKGANGEQITQLRRDSFTAIANARLIAAAPDLAEALAGLLNIAERMDAEAVACEPPSDDEYMAAIEAARAALAKAGAP